MIDAPIQRGPGFIRACSVRLAVPLALALFAAGALVSRFYPGPPPDARTAKTVNDSIVYLYMAQTDWTDTALWRGLKPPAVPVWYHALDATPERLGIAPVFQTFFSAIAWITLGLILASTLRSLPLKIILFCIYAALFAFPPVFGWNKYVLSESLALSWMILFLSAFIAFWRYGALPEAVCLTAAAIGCGLAKDTHALLVAAMILPLAWNALVRQKKYPDQGRYPVRLAAGISACLLAVLIFSQWSAGRTTVTDKPAYRAHPEISAFLDLCSGADLVGRWYLPYLNVLGKKILPNPEARGYFARRGFPLTPAVMARNGTYAGADNFAWHRDPELIAEVKPWIIARGRSVYFHYLARHWRATAAEVFAARNRLLLTVDPELRQHRWFRRPAGGAEAGPHLITAWMSVFFINNSAGLARFFVILALAGLAARKWPAFRAQWNNSLWLSAYLVSAGLAIIFMVYYCDIQDRGRHSLAYVVLMNVGVVWGYFLVIDRAVSALRQKRGRHHVTALARET